MAVYLSLTTRWRSRQASLSATEGWSSCRIRIWPRYSRLAILADLKAEEVADAPRDQAGNPVTWGRGEQRRQEAEVATKRANDLVAEVVEMTSELVEMSRRMAEQTAAMDKMRAEIEESSAAPPSQARRPATTTTREVGPKTIPGLFHERSSNGHRAFVDRQLRQVIADCSAVP